MRNIAKEFFIRISNETNRRRFIKDAKGARPDTPHSLAPKTCNKNGYFELIPESHNQSLRFSMFLISTTPKHDIIGNPISEADSFISDDFLTLFI